MSNAPTKKPVHILHAHTAMSILDGASTVSEYVEYAHESGLNACSCTDHGYVMGVYDLVTQCNKKGVKPIPGFETYLQVPPWYVFRSDRKTFDYFHLTLWAINENGNKNLMKMSSMSWRKVVRKFGAPKAILSWDDLSLYSGDIVCGSGCIEGPIGKPLIRGETEMAIKNAATLKEIFKDRLFFEIMPSKVVKNYTKNSLIHVTDSDGKVYTFLPSDILDTDQGTMTAQVAMETGVSCIISSTPDRFQDFPLSGTQELDVVRREIMMDISLPDDNIVNLMDVDPEDTVTRPGLSLE